ncbi:MAG: DUF2470 domain-containing protein [Alphaproteobacteria bacterium]|nr:DUF2470 domain-containing protein [Alphaproteobacteria bacterium]
MVEGFARTHRLAGGDLLLAPALAAGLCAAEADILAHMNADHREAIGLYATALADARGRDWRMTGVDPEGCDLRRPPRRGEAPDSHLARVDFALPVDGTDAARKALVALARAARAKAGYRRA